MSGESDRSSNGLDVIESAARPPARSFFNNAWRRLTSWRQLLPLGVRDAQQGYRREEARRLVRACLDEVGGEVAARARAAELGYLYLGLEEEEKFDFLELLATEFDVDGEKLAEVTREYLADGSTTAYRSLREASQPTRIELLKRLNSLPDGFRFLVDLRADLLSFLAREPRLARLDYDLQTLFEGWFDVGLLTFSEITWDSPASTLERLVEYEAVHRIRSWTDLKNRLSDDRRCYAFFHPKIPGDPLIFVEVALTTGTPAKIAPLLDEDSPTAHAEALDTAVFYSITNTQRGLRGISFGSFLLKQVMEDLSLEVAGLRRFVTLSPIPGFRRWLEESCSRHGDALLKEGERQRLGELLAELSHPYPSAPAENGQQAGDERGRQTHDKGAREPVLTAILSLPAWWQDDELCEALREPLLDLCAYYLLEVRRGDRPRDPVARFHVTNGASVDRLNWLGDTSPTGIEQSLGLMVNYLYSAERLERNHESFHRRSEMAASAELRRRATQRGSLPVFSEQGEALAQG